jgi:hypothetical protein
MRANSPNVMQIVSSSFSSKRITLSANQSENLIKIAPKPVLTAECENPDPAWIWCDDFEVDRSSQYGMFDTAGGRFTREAGEGRNGSYGMQGIFDPDLPSNAGDLEVNFGRIPNGPPHMAYTKPVDAGTADYRQIYWRFYVRTEEGWEGGNGEKLTRTTVYANTSRSQAMIAHAWAHNARPQVFVLSPVRGTDLAGNVVTTRWNDFPNLIPLIPSVVTSSSLMPTNNEWVCVEVMVKLNDPGQSNGEMYYWKNDILQGRLTGYNYLSSYTGYGINAVRLENWWSVADDGPWGPPTNPPKRQKRYFDNFVVSTQRIWCRG